MIESDLLALELNDVSQPLLEVCTALLRAEVNLVQTYPLMLPNSDRNLLAIMVDNLDIASETLVKEGFQLITEDQLIDLS